MAKIAMRVTLKNDAGVAIGNFIESGDQPTRTAAEAVIATEIQNRVTAAQQTAGALVDAQTAFNS